MNKSRIAVARKLRKACKLAQGIVLKKYAKKIKQYKLNHPEATDSSPGLVQLTSLLSRNKSMDMDRMVQYCMDAFDGKTKTLETIDSEFKQLLKDNRVRNALEDCHKKRKRNREAEDQSSPVLSDPTENFEAKEASGRDIKKKNRPGQRTRRKQILERNLERKPMSKSAGAGELKRKTLESFEEESLHPSWQAKKKQKLQIAEALEGSGGHRIVF